MGLLRVYIGTQMFMDQSTLNRAQYVEQIYDRNNFLLACAALQILTLCAVASF